MHRATLEHTLHGHLKGVWCLKFLTKNLLCSGSYDCTLKIWNILSWTCSRTLFAHTGPIWSIVRCESMLVSASKDKTAKVWDMSCCSVLFNLIHKEPVYSVDIQDKLIVTGSGDQIIKLWDTSNGLCLKTIYLNSKSIITSISIDQDYIACASMQTIYVIKIENRGSKFDAVIVRSYKEHLRRVESLKLKIINKYTGEGLITSGSQDGFIKYWDIKKEQSTHTFDIHGKKAINCVYFDDYVIASAANDNTIKILNFLDPAERKQKK